MFEKDLASDRFGKLNSRFKLIQNDLEREIRKQKCSTDSDDRIQRESECFLKK